MLENLSWDGSVAEKRKYCEPGIYTGLITDWKFGKSLKKGTDYLELQLKSDDGAAAKKTFYLTEKTMPFVARQMIELDRPFDCISEILQLNFKGLKVKFKVIQGEQFTEVTWISAIKESEDLAKPAPDVVTTEDNIPF